MATIKLTKASINSLFKKITGNREEAFGDYVFESLRILIRRKNPLSVQERSKRLYDKRRSAGLCIVCGAKVIHKNPLTGRLYRCCDKHHKAELAKKRKKRILAAKKSHASKVRK